MTGDSDGAATVDRAKRDLHNVAAQRRKAATIADRLEVLLSGDLALRHAVERAYGFDHLPTEEEMVQLAERWRPYRSLAVSYLFASEYGA
jgi:hypothetical protein